MQRVQVTGVPCGRWSGRAHPSLVSELRTAVGEFAAGSGFTGTSLDDVRASVSEAVTNAVVHAFPGDGRPGTVSVEADLGDDEWLVRVTDDGAGFRPRTDSPGLGLGIPTIVAMTTTMTINVPRRGGTEICMTFTRLA